MAGALHDLVKVREMARSILCVFKGLGVDGIWYAHGRASKHSIYGAEPPRVL